jgi:hypothetical protein
MRKAKTPSQLARENGRTIAVTHLVEGKILIGETVTIDTITDIRPVRRRLRGLIYDICNNTPAGDLAYMVVLGEAEPIAIRLEPIAPDPAGAG